MPPGKKAPPFTSGTNNPRGRPPATAETLAVRAAARVVSVEMLEVLIDVVRNGEDEKNRIAAADRVLDRAIGKPVQSIEGTDDGPAIRVNFGPTIMVPPESSED